jgi:hypothetical protein
VRSNDTALGVRKGVAQRSATHVVRRDVKALNRLPYLNHLAGKDGFANAGRSYEDDVKVREELPAHRLYPDALLQGTADGADRGPLPEYLR